MAHVYNQNAKLFILDGDGLITFADVTDADSGFRGIWVRKIRYVPATTGQGTQFQTLNTTDTPTLTVAEDTYSVTNTYRITDDSAGGVFSGASAGDWAHIHHSSSGNNLGWYAISGVDGSSHYIDVTYANRALTNDTNANYQIKSYT